MFNVTFSDQTGRVISEDHTTELDAARAITSVELYDNLTLISHSDNIDRSKFRR
jgi:hypothetical protein